MRSGVLALVLALSAPLAVAQYPAKPIRILVPFAAGGVTDIVTRVVAQKISADTGQNFVVENKTGAAGRICYEAGAKSPADGYTLTAVDGAYPVLPGMFKLPWDYATDLVPITQSAQMPYVVVVNKSSGIDSFAQLIERAKASPGKINYGSAGVGGANHMVTELLKRSAGIDLVHVPFKGMSEAMAGVIGGAIDVVVTAMPTAMSNMKTGRIVPLAVTSAARSPVLPGVPAADEVVPGFVSANWVGLTAPKGTPPEAIEWMHSHVVAALKSADVRERLDALGAVPSGITPAEFGRVLRDDAKRWAEIIVAAGIKPE